MKGMKSAVYAAMMAVLAAGTVHAQIGRNPLGRDVREAARERAERMRERREAFADRRRVAQTLGAERRGVFPRLQMDARRTAVREGASIRQSRAIDAARARRELAADRRRELAADRRFVTRTLRPRYIRW